MAVEAGGARPAFPAADDTPLRVARNALMTSALGGVTGVTLGVLRSPAVEPLHLAVRMAGNWFAFGFGFFGHTEHMAASAMSGAAVGLVGARLVRRPLVPSMCTMAVVCMAGQLACNEVALIARRFLDPPAPAPPVTRSAPAPPPRVEPRAAATASVGSDTDEQADAALKGRDTAPASYWQRAKNYVAEHSLVQPLSDDQYRQRLLEQRSVLASELRYVEDALAQQRDALAAAAR